MAKRIWVIHPAGSADLPPLANRLCRMRIRDKGCLEHVTRLLNLEHPSGARVTNLGYRIAMGPRQPPGCPFPALHCWLEVHGVVIDLTTPEKFWDRAYYYRVQGVVAKEVLYYTLEEAGKLVHQTGDLRFWGFEEAD